MKSSRFGLAVLVACAASANASIIGVTGATTWLGVPPVGCNLGQLTGLTAYAWDEKQNVPLTLSVDMVNNPGSSLAPTAGTLSGVYSSHFLHFEPVPGAVGASGTVTFQDPIVGVIFTPTLLDASDGPAGAPATSYPTLYPFRGLSTVPLSFVTISANVLTFNLHTVVPTQFLNQVRVITATPEPGSVALLGLGALICGRRRR
jgi:hypothetical protein